MVGLTTPPSCRVPHDLVFHVNARSKNRALCRRSGRLSRKAPALSHVSRLVVRVSACSTDRQWLMTSAAAIVIYRWGERAWIRKRSVVSSLSRPSTLFELRQSHVNDRECNMVSRRRTTSRGNQTPIDAPSRAHAMETHSATPAAGTACSVCLQLAHSFNRAYPPG